MYLNRLTIYGFGQFHDRTFNLRPGLSVFLGPNEAGKSTLTQFISAILFGFPTKKHPTLRYEPLDGSRFGGEIAFTHGGQDYLVTRVDGPRGGKVTLHNMTSDLKLPAESLPHLLAPMDATLFQQVYAINEPRLAAVFTTSKQELVAHLRHVGAVGSDFWLDQASQLDEAANARYKPQGRNPELNRDLQEYRDLRLKLERANAAYPKYWRLLDQQRQLNQHQASLRTQLEADRQQVAIGEQRLAKWPIYQQWATLATAADPVQAGFAPEDAATLERLVNQQRVTQESLIHDQQELTAQRQAAQLTPLFQRYLETADRLAPTLAAIPETLVAKHTAEQAHAQQADLQDRAGSIEQQYAHQGQMPRAFSLATLQEVNQLRQDLTTANQKRHRLQQNLNDLNEQFRQQQPTRQQQRNPLADKQIGWLAAGLVVLIGSLFLPSAFLKLGGALVGVAVGYYGAFIVSSGTPASQQTDELEADIRDLQAQLREGSSTTTEVTNRLDTIGESHGMADIPLEEWATAQGAIAEWERLTRQLESVTTALQTAQQKVKTFQTTVTALLPELADQPLQDQVDQLTDLQRQQQRLATRDSDLSALSERVTRDHTRLKQATTAVTTFLQTRNVADAQAFYQQYRSVQERDQRQQRRADLAHQLGKTDLAALQGVTDEATLQAAFERARQRLAATQAQLDSGNERLATLAGQVDQLTTSGTQAVLRQKLADLETRMIATTQRWLVDRLASQWIAAALAAASSDRLPQIVAKASEFYGKLTENRYTKIELTETTLRVRRHDGEWRTVSQLSRGTAEQLDFAVKLAFAIVMTQQVQMPVVIDDGFVNFDVKRRRQAYRLLDEISRETQVILMTADTAVTENVAEQQIIQLVD